jgi:hypothetical protein
MRLLRRRIVFGIISVFILCTLLFNPAISNINFKKNEIEIYKLQDFNNNYILFVKQNFKNKHIENLYNFDNTNKIDCSCYNKKEKEWYPRILCTFLLFNIVILNIKINLLELLYIIIRIKIILNNILDLLDAKSGLINLMEVFNCPRIPN